MATPLYTTQSGHLYHAGQILISTVGLPRGKTHSAKALERYLRWLGVKTRVFSLGDYRRSVIGDPAKLPADYFARTDRSEETESLRRNILEGMEQIIEDWFVKENGQVAIYDANNGTIKLRERLRNRFKPNGIHMFFLESVCDRKDIIEANIRAVKLNSPDYKGWSPDDALADYWRRIKEHEEAYETIEQPSFPYVKIVNVGERIVVNNIRGYLQSRIVFFLMNIHNKPRTIWLARSGQSEIEHSYRADASLSTEGVEYAEQLRSFIVSERRKAYQKQSENEGGRSRVKPLTVWTSSRKRCIETCYPFMEVGFRVKQFTQMSEINPGVVDGMSPEEIKEMYPEEYERHLKEPFSHRYQRAESYHDLSVRLEPVIFNLERHKGDLLIIAHASVLRCLFSYLKGLSPQDIPAIEIQRGDAIEITPTSYGMLSKTHHFAVDPSQPHIGADAYIYGSPINPPVSLLQYRPVMTVESIRKTMQESQLEDDL